MEGSLSSADSLFCPSVELKPMTSLAINKAKLDGIRKQLKFIPTVYQGLYLSLTADESADVIDEATEPDSENEVQNIYHCCYIGVILYISYDLTCQRSLKCEFD